MMTAYGRRKLARLFPYRVTCQTCKGPASTMTPENWVDKWVHADPRVCAQNLEKKRIDLEKKERELEQRALQQANPE